MTKAFFCDGCKEYKLGEALGVFITNDLQLMKNNLSSGHLDFESIQEYCDECVEWLRTHRPPPKNARD